MRHKAFRFRPACDVVLLKDVVSIAPWGVGHGNGNTSATIMANGYNDTVCLDHGACKRRFDSLIEAHRKGELASLRASVTEEEYAERQQLLTDITSRVRVC
ncbi:TPA: hypothetical protein N0F65_002600 [Lagenidium giganteum]|uniref:Uncharacterized protein n=1 Tax=Lagenidium giganteum TaxID=4803 RepID=A0AAV2YXY0_9STRA|nr:TPA: hypothetical protein N0F65_002600 [Lagenidium giganteum]